jgi:hypothetical protein
MHRKNVQRFEGHGVIAAQHILITQEIREIGRQSIPHPFIDASRNGSTTEFKPKQLPGVKHLSVVLIPPSMEAVSFIASWYLVVGNKERLHGTQDRFGFGVPCQVCTIWGLEEPSSVLCSASFTVIFDGKHAVLGRTRLCIRIGIHRVAMGT